jgi:hypothetical protein
MMVLCIRLLLALLVTASAGASARAEPSPLRLGLTFQNLAPCATNGLRVSETVPHQGSGDTDTTVRTWVRAEERQCLTNRFESGAAPGAEGFLAVRLRLAGSERRERFLGLGLEVRLNEAGSGRFRVRVGGGRVLITYTSTF